ncbi:MAG: AMP-binding protein [Candidatus Lokiarchaeota archaeon]|nr:AMP-binding protein [Candidatus Lokiarchaeota archaeon]
MKIGDLIKGFKAREPDKLALVSVSTNRRFTAKELNQAVNSLSNYLLSIDIKKSDRIAIIHRNDHQIVISYFGIVKTGAICVPLNYKLSANELEYCLNNCEPLVLIFDDEDYGAIVENIKDNCPSIKYYIDNNTFEKIIEEYPSEEPKYDKENNRIRIRKNDTAFILYTGGTTGFPKGVMLSHNNLISTMYAVATKMLQDTEVGDIETKSGFFESFSEKTGVFCTDMPIFHAGATYGLFVSLYGNFTFVTHKKFDPIVMFETIEKERVSLLQAVPTMLIQLMENFNKAKNYDLSSLNTILYGAAPIHSKTLKKAMKMFEDAGYNIDWEQTFGATETAVPVTTLSPEDHRKIENNQLDELASSAGKPIDGLELKILDEKGNELPTGEVGEIWVKGDGIMQGYWRNEEKTKKVLKDGWYNMGDMGYVNEEGYVFVMDRSKDMIVSGGENIFSKEVENAIIKHPGVKICAVIGIPDEKWGEAICAIIVPEKEFEEKIDEQEIINHCKDYIASYKKPKKVVFRKTVPVSPQGKILKKKLREEFWKDKERRV